MKGTVKHGSGCATAPKCTVFIQQMLILLVSLLSTPVPSLALPTRDTQEVTQAKEEFLQAFKAALSKFLESESPIPSYIEDTPAVKQAKDEFFDIFNDALDGIIKYVYLEDTEEVKNAKDKFFGLFEDALNNSQKTVKQSYLEDTAEVREAKEKFQQAFKDAKIGKTGRQFIENTAEVKIARKRFFQFYEFVLVGMLERLAPKPGQNSLPSQVMVSCCTE